jgi:hypothetical protein
VIQCYVQRLDSFAEDALARLASLTSPGDLNEFKLEIQNP